MGRVNILGVYLFRNVNDKNDLEVYDAGYSERC